jgi:hypothetical protein
MRSNVFSLREILAVASIHPFYAAQVQYPPDAEAIQAALASAAKEPSNTDLRLVPLTVKKDL